MNKIVEVNKKRYQEVSFFVETMIFQQELKIGLKSKKIGEFCRRSRVGLYYILIFLFKNQGVVSFREGIDLPCLSLRLINWFLTTSAKLTRFFFNNAGGNS